MEVEEVCSGRFTEYRARVARANYLSQDRLDGRYAVKELSRDMPAPKEANFRAPKRRGRYLKQLPRYVHTFGHKNRTRRWPSMFILIAQDVQ